MRGCSYAQPCRDLIYILVEAKDPDSVVMEEEIDPNYVPAEDEVIEYAKWLGMELDKDKDLFWIAREALMVSAIA